MDVFVIPVGRDRHELYSETVVDEVDGDVPATGFLGGLRRGFGRTLRAAEVRSRRRVRAWARPIGWGGRLRDWGLAWVAKTIAEQRLLWTLRRQATAVVVYPADRTYEQVLDFIRTSLGRDFARHRAWLAVHGVGLTLSAIFTIIPGPNLIAYYFAFMVLGHWLSMRGAAHGRRRVKWEGRSSASLAELREMTVLGPELRRARLDEIGRDHRLKHLTAFFERVATRRA